MTIVPAEPSAIIPPAPERGPLRFDPAQLPRPRNPYWVYTQQHPSAESRRKFKGCLDTLAEMISPTAGEDGVRIRDSGASVAWWVLRYDDVEVLRNQLVERYATRTVNLHLSALRSILKVSQRLGLMTAEHLMSTCDVKTMKVNRLPAGRNIPHSEIVTLLSASLSGKEPIATRDAAIIAVLASTGARREEVADMLIENFDSAERTIRIIGKGDKEREAYMHDDALAYLDRWLAVLGEKNGLIFRSIDRLGKIKKGSHLTSVGVGEILLKRQKQAGVRPLTAHDFRRTIAGNLLDAGVDLVTVQEILGHSSPVTTAKYDRRPGRKRRAAIDKLHLPRPEELIAAALPSARGSA